MTFRREMDNRVAAAQGVLHRRRVVDIAADEGESRSFESLEVVRIAGVSKFVQYRDVLFGPLPPLAPDKRRADEARSPGNQKFIHCRSLPCRLRLCPQRPICASCYSEMGAEFDFMKVSSL